MTLLYLISWCSPSSQPPLLLLIELSLAHLMYFLIYCLLPHLFPGLLPLTPFECKFCKIKGYFISCYSLAPKILFISLQVFNKHLLKEMQIYSQPRFQKLIHLCCKQIKTCGRSLLNILRVNHVKYSWDLGGDLISTEMILTGKSKGMVHAEETTG